mmetsp:Transcript_13247/g.14341  ORF Transcript_13247/g.14341 Transcript_13247/m.14341 type:complete len:379 (+) Transcript_13247:76-1212(+)
MSNRIGNQATQGRPNTFVVPSNSRVIDRSVIKFRGRSASVSHDQPSYKKTVETLTIYAHNKINNEEKWKDFNQIAKDFLEHLKNPNYQLKQYQIDLIQDTVLSYLSSLNGRFHTDPSRVRQITDIMTAILIAYNDDHPAPCLLSLEKILKDVNSGSYFFQSQLSGYLRNGIEKQWKPIISDNKVLFNNIGSKLLFFGLLGVIGWPIILLLPLMTHSQRLLQILNEFDHSKRVSAQSIYDLAKIAVMLFACFQLTSIMAAYVTFGYTASALGVLTLGVAQNDSLVKEFSPMIAQYAPAIDKVNQFLDSGDIRQLGQLLRNASSGMNAENPFPYSDQVEELSSDTPAPSAPIIEEVDDADVDPAFTIPTNTGMRQRKKDD